MMPVEGSPPLKKIKVKEGGSQNRSRGEYETPLQPGVAELPDGAWAKWGRDAVYFVAKLKPHTLGAVVPDMGGLTIYAVNTTDASLPIYRIFDFSFHKDNRIRIVSGAVVDSRAYIVGDGHIWARDIGAGDMGWQDGPQFSGAARGIRPELFVLGGKLFAIRFKEAGVSQHELFEVLVDGTWHSLPRPPALARMEENPEPCLSFKGWSCIGDRRVIIHIVYSYSYDDKPHLIQNCFLCFQVNDDFKDGHWTWLKDSFRGRPHPFPPPPPPLQHRVVHSSHLCNGDALVLPALPTGSFLSLFGFGAAPVNKDFELQIIPEVTLGWDPPVEEHSPFHWHLISMGGSRYCAIVFPSRFLLDVTVLTFDRDVTGSLNNLRIQKHELGVQRRPTLFLSGRAYSGSTA